MITARGLVAWFQRRRRPVPPAGRWYMHASGLPVRDLVVEDLDMPGGRRPRWLGPRERRGPAVASGGGAAHDVEVFEPPPVDREAEAAAAEWRREAALDREWSRQNLEGADEDE